MPYPRNAITVVAESPVVRPSLHVQRRFDAPRALLWRAWSRPDSLVAWIGPAEWPAFSVSSDFRVGGAWRIGLKSPETGEELWQGGTYLEIVEEKRLAFTFRWEGAPPGDAMVTVELSETGTGGTVMDFTHSGEEADLTGRRDGWTSATDRLATWLAANPE